MLRFLTQVPLAGVGQFPDRSALRRLAVHRSAAEPAEEHDGVHPVLQRHGAHLLHRLHVRGQCPCWESSFPVVLL